MIIQTEAYQMICCDLKTKTYLQKWIPYLQLNCLAPKSAFVLNLYTLIGNYPCVIILLFVHVCMLFCIFFTAKMSSEIKR